MKEKLKKILRESRFLERINARLKLTVHLKSELQSDNKPKIGFAILALNRPEYLELCLKSLFQSNFSDYDITILIQDGGSNDERVKEIIERDWQTNVKVVKYYSPKRFYSAGEAINSAMKKVSELGDFDIVGWADPDCLFHPDWLDQTMKVFLWAKKNHPDHILGPITSFNSSDFESHRVMGSYKSPFGNYVVKRQAGMLNYFYFKEDFQKLGFFPENHDDETLMTKKFENLKVRNFSTEISWVEHLGQYSLLNEWRPIPIQNAVHAIYPAKIGWNEDLNKFRLQPAKYYADYERLFSRQLLRINLANHEKLIIKIGNFINKQFLKLKNRWIEYRNYINNRKWWEKILREVNYETNISVNIDDLTDTTEYPKGPIDIIMPLVEKDLDTVEQAINSAYKNLNHTVKNVYIVSPESQIIREICTKNHWIFVEESTVLPVTVKDIDYVSKGENRSGWLYQQLLKLNADRISSEKNILILDSDTVFINKHSFIRGNKTLLEISDEFNEPYFDAFSSLLGIPALGPQSFVVHHMLFDRDILIELKSKIEKYTGEKWYRAIINRIDKSTPSCFSEYETYGNYLYYYYPEKIVLEYWYNLSLKRYQIGELAELEIRHKKKYKSLSFQSYNI